MDQVTSRQLVRASNFPLVDRIEADLARRSEQLNRQAEGRASGQLGQGVLA
jgi:hypothetical protein